jgi:hypothetical protein
MSVHFVARCLSAVLIAGLAFVAGAHAQQQPSAAAAALATQILEMKGGIGLFDPAIEGVIAHHKSTFIQMNPNAARALGEIEIKLRTEGAAKRQEMRGEVARAYASQFTEQELRDLLAFYKTPLGKKVIDGEPKAGEEAAKRAQAWIDKYADEISAKMRAELKSKGFSEF